MSISLENKNIHTERTQERYMNQLSKFGQTALEYAQKGWHVMPLTKNSKFPPLIKEW